MAVLTPSASNTQVPPWKRPGAIGWWDEESEKESQSTPAKLEISFPAQEEPAEKAADHGTFLTFNEVTVVENTTTQPESVPQAFQQAFANEPEHKTNPSIPVVNTLDNTAKVLTKASEFTASAITEGAGAVKDLVWEEIFGASSKPAETKPQANAKRAEEEKRRDEIKMFLQQLQTDVQTVRIQEKVKLEQTMARVQVSQQDVWLASKQNINYENALSYSTILMIALNKTKNHAKNLARKMVPGAGKGKAKQGANLTMNLSAQEGQSMVSTSGAIASAG